MSALSLTMETRPGWSINWMTEGAWKSLLPTTPWPGAETAVRKTFEHQSHLVHGVITGTRGLWTQSLCMKSASTFSCPLSMGLVTWQKNQCQSLYEKRAQCQEQIFMSNAARLPLVAGTLGAPAPALPAAGGQPDRVRDVDGDVLSEEDDDGDAGDEFSVVASLAPPGPGVRSKRRKTEGGAASVAPTLFAAPVAASVISMPPPGRCVDRRGRSVSGSPPASARTSSPLTPSMSSMLDPSAAASAAGSEDQTDHQSKTKISQAERVREELEELKAVHDKRMQEFWWCGDPETAKKLTKGNGRPAYHLGQLATAATKAVTKLADQPEANKFNSRHADWKVVKESLEVFRAVNIGGGEFNKVKKGAEFSEFLETVKARPSVWCKLPLIAVRWGAQLKIET